MGRYSRRTFLQRAGGAIAATAVLPKFARADVNSQIRVAVIGLNNRGKDHMGAFGDHLVALCDCDRHILGRRTAAFERRTGRKLDQVVDYRELLDRQDIDVVSLATPNHTHALMAVQAAEAGKHVYVEKPVSHNIWEGRQIVNAAARYDRIIQTGSQSRSHRAIQEAVEYVRSGKLGPIQYVLGTCYKPRESIGKLDRPLQIPEFIDYDLWCGPAAKVDLYRPKFHYDWHWDFNTGSGDIANQGIHQMDIARWFLGEQRASPRVVSFGGRLGYEDAGNTPNTLVTFHDYPNAPLVFETRGLPRSKRAQRRWGESMDTYRGSQIGVIVQCSEGHVYVSANYGAVYAFDPTGDEIMHWTGGGDHYVNFLDAVRSGRRSDLHADILEGHVSISLCHMGNISYLLGEKRTAMEILSSVAGNDLLHESVDRMMSHLRVNEVDVDTPTVTAGPWLAFDPASERFTDNEQANELTRRSADRAPFIVPSVV